jgi:hypothetical protein
VRISSPEIHPEIGILVATEWADHAQVEGTSAAFARIETHQIARSCSISRSAVHGYLSAAQSSRCARPAATEAVAPSCIHDSAGANSIRNGNVAREWSLPVPNIIVTPRVALEVGFERWFRRVQFGNRTQTEPIAPVAFISSECLPVPARSSNRPVRQRGAQNEKAHSTLYCPTRVNGVATFGRPDARKVFRSPSPAPAKSDQ